MPKNTGRFDSSATHKVGRIKGNKTKLVFGSEKEFGSPVGVQLRFVKKVPAQRQVQIGKRTGRWKNVCQKSNGEAIVFHPEGKRIKCPVDQQQLFGAQELPGGRSRAAWSFWVPNDIRRGPVVILVTLLVGTPLPDTPFFPRSRAIFLLRRVS